MIALNINTVYLSQQSAYNLDAILLVATQLMQVTKKGINGSALQPEVGVKGQQIPQIVVGLISLALSDDFSTLKYFTKLMQHNMLELVKVEGSMSTNESW